MFAAYPAAFSDAGSAGRREFSSSRMMVVRHAVSALKNPGRQREEKGLPCEILRRNFSAVRQRPGRNRRPDVAENAGAVPSGIFHA